MAKVKNKYSATTTQNTLYTKGGEFTIRSTGELYVGQYYISNGVAFTGKPGGSDPIRLLPYTYSNQDAYYYDKAYKFANPVKLYQPPVFFRPQPTTSDYEIGYFFRYVVSHNLDDDRFPIEIGISQANSYGSTSGIDSGIWTLHRVKWVIVGNFEDLVRLGEPVIPGVETQNRNVLEPIIRKYPIMQFAFRNYLEFAQSGI